MCGHKVKFNFSNSDLTVFYLQVWPHPHPSSSPAHYGAQPSTFHNVMVCTICTMGMWIRVRVRVRGNINDIHEKTQGKRGFCEGREVLERRKNCGTKFW